MIEQIVYEYLASYFDNDVPVYMMRPDDQNPEMTTFIVLEKTGSSSENHLHTATIAVQSYAPTLYEAALLNERVKQAMAESITLNDITRCDLNGDYNFTDIESRRPRYQAVFDITHYERG